jgi:hypothetical protein
LYQLNSVTVTVTVTDIICSQQFFKDVTMDGSTQQSSLGGLVISTLTWYSRCAGFNPNHCQFQKHCTCIYKKHSTQWTISNVTSGFENIFAMLESIFCSDKIISIHLVFIHTQYFHPQCNPFIISLSFYYISAIHGHHQLSLFAKTVSLRNMCNCMYHM